MFERFVHIDHSIHFGRLGSRARESGHELVACDGDESHGCMVRRRDAERGPEEVQICARANGLWFGKETWRKSVQAATARSSPSTYSRFAVATSRDKKPSIMM